MKWFPTGTTLGTGIKQKAFNASELETLSKLVPEATEDFILSLENAVTTFEQFSQLQHCTPKPRQIKDDIKKLTKACSSLNKELEEVAPITKTVLDLSNHDLEGLSAQLKALIDQGNSALRQIEKHMQGRPQDFARVQLSCDVARAFEENLGLKTSLTHNTVTGEGSYAKALRYCLEICNGYAPEDLLDLMQKGLELKSKTKSNGNVIITKHHH